MGWRKLKGVRVAVLAMDGFEQVELAVPRRALQLLGARVDVVSPRRGRLRGSNFIYPGWKVTVHTHVSQAGPEHYGALLIPGGLVNPDLLRQSNQALELVRAFERAGRPIATLCHGPWVLASAGLVKGRRISSWPGIKDDMRNAGAHWENSPAVRDGRWFSSRGPQDMRAFLKGMVALFNEYAPRDLPPPEHVPIARTWLPTLARLGAVALAARAVQRA